MEKFVITDSILLKEENKIDKIEIVSVAPLFADAIRRVHSNDSISKMFDNK